MSKDVSFPVNPEWSQSAHVNAGKYAELYRESIQDNEGFWSRVAGRLKWDQGWTTTKNVTFEKPVKIEWFAGGKLNVSVNCIDRHLPHNKDRVAFYWEPETDRHRPLAMTYQMLKDNVCRFANGLKKIGVQKGDRVALIAETGPEFA
nr:acetyl-coenzyme A synthetase N-terminal domain-containing protein [Bdellovibrionales bacterium]